MGNFFATYRGKQREKEEKRGTQMEKEGKGGKKGENIGKKDGKR